MRIEHRDGLLFTSIKITYKGNSKIINDVVIDTGAATSIIAYDEVEDMGIHVEAGDRIMEYCSADGKKYNGFIKKLNEIKIGSQSINDIEIDFGTIDNSGQIKASIGLDILTKVGAVIDLKNFDFIVN